VLNHKKITLYDEQRNQLVPVRPLPKEVKSKLDTNCNLNKKEECILRQYERAVREHEEVEEDLCLQPSERLLPFRQRHNPNLLGLKRAGNSTLAGRHYKHPRHAFACVEEVWVPPTPARGPRKASVQVSRACSGAASSCTRGQTSSSVPVTVAAMGTQVHTSDNRESLEEERLLDSVLQRSKTVKDEQSKLLKECQELVSRRKHLHNRLIGLFKEMKRANPSMKSKPPEDDTDLDDEVAALVDHASIQELHGHCVIKAMELHSSLSLDLLTSFQLRRKLVNFVKVQESELVSRYKAFKDWNRKSEKLAKEKAQAQYEEAKAQYQVARIKQEETKHNEAL
jgi:hypothetical protein